MPRRHLLRFTRRLRQGVATTTFYLHHSQRRYAEAIAQLEPAALTCNGAALWALYKLGLYRTVIRLGPASHSPRGDHARAVSLAACGQLEEARRVATELTDRVAPGLGTRTALADDLAPFVPDLSLRLLGSGDNGPTIRAALQLKLGRTDAAAETLRLAFQRNLQHSTPELHLLQSNVEASPEAERRLTHLNRFLLTHGLSPVALRNPRDAPSPSNLVSSPCLAASGGPLVSVLVTCFNVEDRVGAALDSLSTQSYRDLEIIVVDDASRDGTREVVRDRAARDSRISLIALPCNVGTYAAKNIGLSRASGRFVTCHDADDWSHPEKIARQVAPLRALPTLVATTSHWVRLQDDGTFYARPVHPLMRVNPSSVMFRRRVVLAKVGAWDWVRTGADSEFAARLRLVFGRLAIRRIKLPLAFGSHRPGSLVTAPETGFSDGGIPPYRLDYWEAWGHWHIAELRAGRRPFMPLEPMSARPFPVRPAQAIDPVALYQALGAA